MSTESEAKDLAVTTVLYS